MYTYWFISGIVLVLIAAGAGLASKSNHILGILIDSRDRYSLNNLQITGWTILILSSFLALFLTNWVIPTIPATLLGLLGISVTSAVSTTAIKADKDQNRGDKIERGKAKRRFLQILLEEEGEGAGLVSVTKFQNLVFTVVLWILYVSLFTQATPPSLPNFPQEALWLIGISHAGYVTWKIPNKPGDPT